MNHCKLAFLGFGNVGQALAVLLLRKQDDIKNQLGMTYAITGIATGSRGIAVDLEGIDLMQALELIQSGQSLNALSRHPLPIIESLEFVQQCGADVLFETTPINYETGQPAIDYIQAALSHGMMVTTANKGPVVHAYRELTQLAESKGSKFFFESAVMDGAPVFGLFRETLPVATISSFRGILNSTTNLILARMESGESFDRAVAYAQSIGIAESDPSGDVDGWDAAIKVSALATVMMGVPLTPQDVNRTGIREISAQDIADAKAKEVHWKLVCEAVRDGDQVRAKVAPQKVASDAPMYGIEGTTSIVQFESDVLGTLSLIEENPGPHTTAYGLLADFLNATK